MKTLMLRWLWWVTWLVGMPLVARTTVNWTSDLNAINRTSAGIPLDGQFSFELGVFATSFTPTAANTDQWAANWYSASRTTYDASTKRYFSSFTPTDNVSPFTVGRPAYIWGFRGDASSSEWILFRAPSWTWPSADGAPSPTVTWFAKDADPTIVGSPGTVIVGSINLSGSPFLMQTAAITNSAPPSTSWSQWQDLTLSGQTLNGPNDDPDHDGVPNLLEFVFGTTPLTAGAPTPTPLTVVSGHLQITIPRRIDHSATLTVEVSDDLINWYSGPSYTTVVSDDITALVVCDLTTLDASHPKRFMRLKAELASP